MSPAGTLRGLAFDVDGTLYHQGLLRACMALELAASLATPRVAARRRARRVWRQLAVFRRMRETLKGVAAGTDSLERLQYQKPAERLGCSPTELETVVTEWMHRRPLRYLQYCRRRGVVAFLKHLVDKGYRVAVLSDYPAAAKLEALGVAPYVHVTLCATDASVNALKPHPRGFLQVCDALGLPPSDVLYVGDRPDVDLAGARAAGMHCALIGSRMPWTPAPRQVTFPTFQKLQHELHL
jgi:HAD superfamily hydrolase (TIGR01549 family)